MVLVRAQPSAACNISHTVDEPRSWWLLRCGDLMGSDTLNLTQELIRSSISKGASSSA
jgi:hypothetical protein